MKVRVKAPFFDDKGIHKKGEICEVQNFRPEYMELVEEKKEKVEKAENMDEVKKQVKTYF